MPKYYPIAALDIGTSKISCIIGKYDDDLNLTIAGRGSVPSHGVQKGKVVDIEKCAKSIELAVIEAENSAGFRINNVYVSISGEHIDAGINKGALAPYEKSVEFSLQDQRAVLDKAAEYRMPDGYNLMHVLPRSYYIDGYNGVENPVGLWGNRLEVDAYLIMGMETYIKNIVKAVEKSGLEVEPRGIFLSPLASANLLLSKEDRKLGVLFMDIGAGTSKLLFFRDGKIFHVKIIRIGGDNITYDVAYRFKITMSEAESLKIQKGSACDRLLSPEEENEEMEAISFSESESVNVQRKMLAQSIEPRMMDILEATRREIYKMRDQGVCLVGAVLTGGTARLRDLKLLTSRVLDLPVKVVAPKNIPNLGEWENNPEYSAVVGSLYWGFELKKKQVKPRSNPWFRIFVSIYEFIYKVF